MSENSEVWQLRADQAQVARLFGRGCSMLKPMRGLHLALLIACAAVATLWYLVQLRKECGRRPLSDCVWEAIGWPGTASDRRERVKQQRGPEPSKGEDFWTPRWPWSSANKCKALEDLLRDEIRSSQDVGALTRNIESEIFQLLEIIHVHYGQLQRADCWDNYLLSKSLRRIPQCIKLHEEREQVRRKVASLREKQGSLEEFRQLKCRVANS